MADQALSETGQWERHGFQTTYYKGEKYEKEKFSAVTVAGGDAGISGGAFYGSFPE